MMGESNTPPVSPKSIMDADSDEEVPQGADQIEVYEVEDDEFEVLGDEGDAEVIEEENEEAAESVDIVDDAVCVFKGHQGPVFCCHFEPKEGKLAVSGGEDDKAYVWDVSDGKIVFECTNHRDSVTQAQFSHDGTLVATADMAGLIQVWKIATKSVLWSFEIGDLNWLDWHPASHVLFAGSAEGETWMWKVPSGDCKTFAGHGERNECAKVLADGRRLAVGYVDGSVKVFDLKTCNVVHHFSGGLAHTNGVLCVDGYRDNILLVTGSLDSTAKLYNTQTGKVLATLSCSSSDSSAENSVESVSFCPDPSLSLVATGTLGGRITFWDIPSQVERQSFELGAGVVKLMWHPKVSHCLVAAGLDGIVRLIDARNASLVRQLSGHTANILDLAVSSDGTHILTSSEDQTVRVFLAQV